MILHYMGLAKSIALRSSLHKSAEKKEEYVAQAYLLLTKAVSRIEKGSLDNHTKINVTGYLIKTIRFGLRNFRAKDRLVGVTEVTFKRKGGQVKGTIYLGDSDLSETMGDLVELKELAKKAVNSSIETKILCQKILGKTDVEIAELCGCTDRNISYHRRKIRTRMEELLNGNRNLSGLKC